MTTKHTNTKRTSLSPRQYNKLRTLISSPTTPTTPALTTARPPLPTVPPTIMFGHNTIISPSDAAALSHHVYGEITTLPEHWYLVEDMEFLDLDGKKKIIKSSHNTEITSPTPPPSSTPTSPQIHKTNLSSMRSPQVGHPPQQIGSITGGSCGVMHRTLK